MSTQSPNSAKRPKPRPPLIARLVVILLLPILLVRLAFMIVGLRRAHAYAERWVTRNAPRCGALIIEHDQAAQTTDPHPEFIRSWFAEHFGRTPRRWLAKSTYTQLWRERYRCGVLFRFPAQMIFREAGVPTHTPARSPFEPGTGPGAGWFVYLTNRGGDFFSYLAHEESLSGSNTQRLPFTMGYTALWVCEHVETVTPEGSGGLGPRAWRTLPYELYPALPMGRGEWIVFCDPCLSKWPSLSSSNCLVDRFEACAEARACAELFTSEYRVVTVVARLVTAHDWH